MVPSSEFMEQDDTLLNIPPELLGTFAHSFVRVDGYFLFLVPAPPLMNFDELRWASSLWKLGY
jgi:hypothetical protein